MYRPETGSFNLKIEGISVGGNSVSKQAVGFIDSGTTWTYIPVALFDGIYDQVWDHCSNQTLKSNSAQVKGCQGGIAKMNDDFGYATFCAVKPNSFNGTLKEFFLGYPVISFAFTNTSGQPYKINWFPSEYFYLGGSNKYCFAAEKQSGNQLLIGTTQMRQYNYIFDVDNKTIGLARTKCSEDKNMITHSDEYGEYFNKSKETKP
jgi:hypothetical protein